MKNFLLYLICTLCIAQSALAQSATYGIPFSIGTENCGSTSGATQLYRFGTGGGTSGTIAYSYDSLFFFNYSAANLSRSTVNKAMFPRLRIGTSIYNGRISGTTLSQMDRFSTSGASVSFNPKDGMIYYIWTDYSGYASATLKSYIWRWKPDTTFASSLVVPYRPAPAPVNLLDTFKSFTYDIGGVTFDNTGKAWVLEFSSGGSPYKGYLRQMDFTAGTINAADTLTLIPTTGGIGDTIYNVNSGDITLTPSGQMYFVFNNKLYTPDYGSYGNPTHKIDATCLDTLRTKPAGSTNFVGLGFADGDLLGAYSTGCYYGKIDPVTGIPSATTYTYTGAKGVASNDLAQINSGVGVAKKLASINPTGTPGQYDVVYDVYVKNYGNVPISNLQVTDNLANINGAGNLSNVSTTMMTIPPPPGIALNTGFNGNADINLLNSTGQNLPNYPTDSSSFVIRINCTISNVIEGVVYKNSAIATANGFKNVALRDSSTNGDVPDLNQNDKPDDVSEGIPTPFLIALKPTPSPCGTLTSVLYSENFGTGAGLTSTLPTSPNTFSTTYTGAALQPIAKNTYTLTNNAKSIDTANFNNLSDHTGGGRMMAFNADAAPRILFRDTMPTSCPGRQYTLSFWTAFPTSTNYFNHCDALGGFRFPQFTIRMRDITTGLTVVEYKTDSLTNSGWQLRGMRWTMPLGYSNLILEIENAGPGGCGNDVVLDDILYGSCDALPVVNSTAVSGCIGTAATFTGSLADSAVLPGPKEHQWQVATSLAGPYVDIPGATSPTYTINPVLASDTGKYYRLSVAAFGSISIPICRSSSGGIKLNGAAPSVAATAATKSKNNICPGIAVNLGITGGTLGDGASWKWYTGSLGGTLVASGTTISVTPAVTTTYYVRAEGNCNTTSGQSVTVFVSCDIDKDKDGIPDYVESNMPAAFLDVPANGIINAYDPLTAGYVDNNNDFINDNYQADGDSDGDGIPNYLDTTFPGRVDTNGDNVDDRFDADLDGIINMLDLDSDNDGIPDVVEAYGVDTDGDGLIDSFNDTDGDGLTQSVDVNTSGAYNTGAGLGLPDFDGDLIPNFLDLDSDNDGIPDIIEAGGVDVNNNGRADGAIAANGWATAYSGTLNALLKTGTDAGGDGKADSYPNKNLDQDLRPNAYDLDSDGDGIADAIEAGGAITDTDLNGKADGPLGTTNGWSTTVSAAAALSLRNTDGVGNPDYLDIDSDGDGIPDNIEGQATALYKLPTTVDTDGDGLMNPYDNISGFGGSGIFVYDHDADGTPDYRDLDSDADGSLDLCEGNDWNLNGICDEVLTPTGADADGDGLDDRFDALNSTSNIKGTSYMMGASGSLTGDATPGAFATVQKKIPSQSDRDWRYVGTVLPVQFLGFTGYAQSAKVDLSWSIITTKDISSFEIERSTDNNTFNPAGTVSEKVALNTQQNFGFIDDISGIPGEVVYYRLKVIGTSGEIKYSNVLVVRRTQVKTPVTVVPNPATEYVTVRFFTEQETEVTIRLVDNIGKTVLLQKQKASKGNNIVQLNNLAKYSNGVYSLQVLINDEIVTQKLILSK